MFNRVMCAVLFVAVAASAQDSAEAFADAWVETFEQRDTERLEGLLSEGYAHTSMCGLVTKTDEASIMGTVFRELDRFDVLDVTAAIVGEGATDGLPGASLLFSYSFRHRNGGTVSEISGEDIIIAAQYDTGRWQAKNWLELYQEDQPDCGDHLVSTLSAWLSAPTAVSEVTLGSLKRDHQQ